MATVKLFNHHFRTPFLFLLLFEFAVFLASVYLGVYLRFEQPAWHPDFFGVDNLPLKALVFSLMMLSGMVAMGQYQTPDNHGKHFLPYTLVRVSFGMLLSTVGLLAIFYIFPEVFLGRGLVAYAMVSAFISIVIIRVTFYHTVDHRVLRRKVLVYGAGKLASGLLGSTKKRELSPKNVSYLIHGFVPVEGEDTRVEKKYLIQTGSDLVSYCQEYDIDEVVIAINDRRKRMPVDDLLDCKLSNINVMDFVAFWERERSMLRLDMLHPSWIIFCEGCEQGNLNAFLSRAFDISISLVILLLMLPILMLTAILIFIESGLKGPIFYRQKRVGFNGEHFQLLKFRSMVVDAEKQGEAQWAKKNDARVTRVGKFIRKVRIDELPQLINILRGDMSIVGPRPERPEFVAELENHLPYYSSRHRVKPGLAGWAQLKYPYGASKEDAYNKLQYDLYYVKNHSLMMDILILLQTIEVILLGKGAR